MSLKKYNIILLAALIISCSEENNTVALGETINVSAEIPEESKDLEFIWELTSVPQNSSIDNNNIEYLSKIQALETLNNMKKEYNVQRFNIHKTIGKRYDYSF